MEPSRTYLLYSIGGSVEGTDVVATPELSVVEIPPTMDLKALEGKAAMEQVSAIFKARLEEVRRLRAILEHEEQLLGQATSSR